MDLYILYLFFQICYGMIYGMSANSLAQQLNTTKDEADVFMKTFKKSYPGKKKTIFPFMKLCILQNLILNN